jgi:uncharacterized RDD family membrane protein YckC
VSAPARSAVPIDEIAGIVTRTVAVVIDLLVVMALLGGLLLIVAGLSFAWSPLSFQWPAPPWALTMGVGALIAGAYLTIAWATSGRTLGAGFLGLRVLSEGGARLGWARAAIRAMLCLAFPPGLAWAAVSRRRRSVQDVVLHTVVVYDWSDDVGLRQPASPPYGEIDRT